MRKLSDHQFKENEILKEKILLRVSELLENKDYILGQGLTDFENSFARYCGVRFAVGTSSGSSALKLALTALNLQKDDEVIVPAHTFISTALSVVDLKARLVLCDVDENTFNIDTEKLKNLITSKTKAIIPVHLYGQMARLEEIRKIAGPEIVIIEDAAQAHGATRIIDGKKEMAGSFGEFGCFSFYPTKNLGALGDAGCILSNDNDSYEKLKALRNYGQFKKHDHEIMGGNERLDTIQAIILSEKLMLLDELNEKRREVAKWYFDALKNLDLILPSVDANNTHVFHQFVIKVKNRDNIFELLQKAEIPCGIHYPKPVHLHTCFNHLGFRRGEFPVSEKVCNEILSLPMSPYLNKDDVEFIAKTLKEII